MGEITVGHRTFSEHFRHLSDQKSIRSAKLSERATSNERPRAPERCFGISVSHNRSIMKRTISLVASASEQPAMQAKKSQAQNLPAYTGIEMGEAIYDERPRACTTRGRAEALSRHVC